MATLVRHGVGGQDPGILLTESGIVACRMMEARTTARRDCFGHQRAMTWWLALGRHNVIALRRIDRLMTRAPMTADTLPRPPNANTACQCNAAPIGAPETLAVPNPMTAYAAITDHITRKVGGARKWPNLCLGHAANRAGAAYPGRARG